MNIISLTCANARIHGIYMNEQYKRELAYKYTKMYKYEIEKDTHEFAKRKLERYKGVWKDEALDDLRGSTLPLRYSELTLLTP